MNTVTVEQLIEEAKNQGIELTAEEAKEALETVQSIDFVAEDGELSDDALENVAGGISVADITNWLKKMWNKRPGKSYGKISSWEKDLISLAGATFGAKGTALATAMALVY